MAGRHRFPRCARLLHPAEFDAAFKNGRRCSAKFLSAIASASSGPQSRLGLTVSKKNAPRAVDRNRIKRQIRESFRRMLPLNPAVDIVVSARGGSAKASSAELRADLQQLWSRITLSCAKS